MRCRSCSFASLSVYSNSLPNKPWRLSRYRCAPISGAMAAGSNHTWMAKNRESVAVPTAEEVDHVPAHERRVRPDLHPYHGGPEAVLVPPEEVPREGKPDHEQEQDHADHPVELPRRLVAAREEHLAHVQPDKRHQEVRRPVVDAADELPEVGVVHDVVDRVPRI